MLDQLNVLVYWKHNTKQAFSKGAKSGYGVKSWVEWSGVERSGVVEWSLYCRIEL